ncbi:MAG: mismatch-specific DNA-glycosylase [Deltaproteobacteria bacterium]|nr:mismatch-specific DNA-glycosylase [Deltaproteobacteria bacterium]
MIRYQYKNSKLLFIGINPHHGSFRRGVPFSNNKLFWYLLSRSGIIAENETDLKDETKLKQIYVKKFNRVYKIGFVNIIDRPTRDITELEKDEEIPGRKRIYNIIRLYRPVVACFIGKIAYQKFLGSKEVSFGWQNDIHKSRVFVMHFPLRGKAAVRIRELIMVAQAAKMD